MTENKALIDIVIKIMANRSDDDSLDVFTFPRIAIQDQDHRFEFAMGRPPDSPADHIFFNGKLLPHTFPVQTEAPSCRTPHSMLVSCRSSSARSSSARTSLSDVSERRPLYQSKSVGRVQNPGGVNRSLSSHQHNLNRSSARWWQFIIPLPPLSHEGPRRRKSNDRAKASPHDGPGNVGLSPSKKGSCCGFFRSFSSTCKQCHALEPPKKKDEDSVQYWIH